MSRTEAMIPTLPKSVTMEEKLEFYDNMLSNLEDQSTIHVNWHTHKQNPAVCWICDIPILARVIVKLLESFITKSPLDNETELSSGDDSELEIEDTHECEDWESCNICSPVIDSEENLNEPEFDIDEDGYRNKEETE